MKKLISMLLAVSMLMSMGCCALADGEYANDRTYSGYTTLYGSSANKIYNVELAAKRLNGYVLRAGSGSLSMKLSARARRNTDISWRKTAAACGCAAAVRRSWQPRYIAR